MKFNLFKTKPDAMVAAEPTGATTAAVTATPALASTAADLSGSNNTEISKNDMFEEIKSKFLNEIDKIPREFLARVFGIVVSGDKIQAHSPCWHGDLIH